MKRFTFSLVLILAMMALMSTGCETRNNLSRQMDALKADLAQLETQGAKVCTPREYAAAEANLAFAYEEWTEREYIAANDFIVLARTNIANSRKWLGNCVSKVPPDRDGDGVLDDVDKCPDQPGPAYNNGCPDPDSDNDGVPDSKDRCPKEPGPPFNDGCPADADKDGVMDNVDKCPNAPGPKENDGCPKLVKVTENSIQLLQMINFETNKSAIKPESYPILDEITAILKVNPSWRINIEGHTDNKGSAAKNKKLSQDRADSCRTYLIQHGVEAGRMMAAGYGPDRPIASNNTNEGRAKNRRTEFKIVSK